MKNIILWFRAVFGFNQKEINGFVILSLIMVLLLVAPFFYPFIFKNEHYDSSSDDRILQNILSQTKKVQLEESTKSNLNKKPVKHLTKKKKTRYTKEKKTKFQKREKKVFKKKAIVPITINSADTIALQQIRGIGSKLSQRIINYRKKLGGFHSINQLKEVYGIDSLLIIKNVHHFINPDLSLIEKINVNTTTIKELVSHPYISYKQSIAIINYREQHGNYNSLEDLSKIHLLTTEDILKLKLYLAF